MRQFPAIYRLALMFTGFVFLALCSVFLVFGWLYQSLVDKQLLNDFNREMQATLAEHLIVQDRQITFIKDTSENTLRQQLIAANMSAWFGDQADQPIRTYGLFSVTPTLTIDSYRTSLLEAKSTKKPQILTLELHDQPIRLFVVPLVAADGQVIGTLVLARSLAQLMSQYQIMVWSFFSLLALSLIGSFGLGIFLARQALRPIVKIGKVVKQIDLDNIHNQIEAEGHPQDAVYLLGESINAMLDRISQATDKQKAFVAHASHELKTPLSRAISSLELLPVLPIKSQQLVESVIAELFGLSTLINQLLVLSKLSNSHQTPKSGQIDLVRLVQGLKKKFDQDLLKKHLDLKINLMVNPVLHLPLEKTYLQLVLANLISNAIKYSYPGGHVNLVMSQHKKTLEISIVDQGTGMSLIDLAQATQPFYRAPITTKLAPGYGIGLAIVKQICDLHQLEFNLTSQKNLGTTAKIILPILV